MTETETDIHTAKQIDRQTDRPIGRHTDRDDVRGNGGEEDFRLKETDGDRMKRWLTPNIK